MKQELKTLFNNEECKTKWLYGGIHSASDWVITNMEKQGYVWEDYIDVFWDIQKQQHQSNVIENNNDPEFGIRQRKLTLDSSAFSCYCHRVDSE